MNRYLAALLVTWWVGAVVATVALFIPVYNSYFVVGAIGWGIIVVCTYLIFFEMRRVKAEDKKKENLKTE